MFEVGKLCDESLDSFLGELEKVSLLDAEGEGEVSRYFAHAVSRPHIRCNIYFGPFLTDLCLLIGYSTFHDYHVAQSSGYGHRFATTRMP